MATPTKSPQSLSNYLRDAVSANTGYRPPAYGQPYRTPMFEFVRSARAHPELASLDAMDAVRKVESVIRQWPGANGQVPGQWAHWFPHSDDPVAEFVETWERVKWPKPELDMALQEATLLPLTPARSYSPQYAQFVALAGHLQRRSGDRAIFLPCRKIASVLGCTLTSVSRYRRMAMSDGLMTVTAKHMRSERKADEFRFHCELFDWQTGKQIDSGNLNICVTPESKIETAPACYTDSQTLRNSDTQETQEIQEIQENHEKHEKQETQDSISKSSPLSDADIAARRALLAKQAEELMRQQQEQTP